MPRLEGGPRDLDKRMKSRGLQKLNFFCQPCEKQCRDANAYKQHSLSESHTRQIQKIADNPQKVVNEYTREFQQDFLRLLRTAHGEKPVHLNNFYQSYITDKFHTHMNATRFHSLTEFAKHLGREGICRITEEEDKGLFIAWINDSPEALRRRAAIEKRDRMVKGDEQREHEEIQAQITRAQETAALRNPEVSEPNQEIEEDKELQAFKLPPMQQDRKSQKRTNAFSAFKRQGKAKSNLAGANETKRTLSENKNLVTSGEELRKKTKLSSVTSRP
ncbi:hypothetical protein MMC10_007008 [Thelotrema lepadinum]|nr:hypothetical protein [Thelotrema lepadinum]